MKNLKKFEISKENQKSINGGDGLICCERCPDGSCNGYTTRDGGAIKPCQIALPCGM